MLSPARRAPTARRFAGKPQAASKDKTAGSHPAFSPHSNRPDAWPASGNLPRSRIHRPGNKGWMRIRSTFLDQSARLRRCSWPLPRPCRENCRRSSPFARIPQSRNASPANCVSPGRTSPESLCASPGRPKPRTAPPSKARSRWRPSWSLDSRRLRSLPMLPSYSSHHRCTTLYLNPATSQFRPQLLRILIVNRFNPQLSRIFQVQRPVIDEHAFLRRPLCHLQRDPIYHLLRLPRVQITRAEEHLEIPPQMKRRNPVFVQLQRLVVDRPDKILSHTRHSIQHRPRFRELPRLREHERRELLAREGPRPVEQRPIQIFIQRNISRIKRWKRKVVPVLKLIPIQMKRFRRRPARPGAPPVGQNDTANIPKQCGDLRQCPAPPRPS